MNVSPSVSEMNSIAKESIKEEKKFDIPETVTIIGKKCSFCIPSSSAWNVWQNVVSAFCLVEGIDDCY